MKRKLAARDFFFFGVATYILYHEVIVAQSAQPLLVFLALYLYGLIPAWWADEARKYLGGGTTDPPDSPGPGNSIKPPEKEVSKSEEK